jgi:hydrogen peroxide-dependent heme synthase
MTDSAADTGDTQRLKARDLNELIRYTMWAVFTVTDRDFAGVAGGEVGRGVAGGEVGRGVAGGEVGRREAVAAELTDLIDQANGKGIVTRGCYDLQGMRADADFMLWWVAPTSDELQEMYVNFRRTKLGYASEPVWTAMALHRPAEFNKSHIPAFLAGEEPKNYVCVYPFVRSLEWYLLEDADRRKMLAEHGKMAREYPDVRANTVSCFALNDYEWMLAFEADELHRIVDLMRHLRGAEARRHTRVEIPFYTGRRKSAAELVASLA